MLGVKLRVRGVRCGRGVAGAGLFITGRSHSRSRSGSWSGSHSRTRSRSSLRRWSRRWCWRRLVKPYHRLWQHQVASIADLPHHGVQSTLEGDIVVLICVPECIPHPRSQDQTEPSLRLEAFCQHKRYHIKLLLMCVVGLQPTVDTFFICRTTSATICQKRTNKRNRDRCELSCETHMTGSLRTT